MPTLKKPILMLSNRKFLLCTLSFLVACALITAFITEWRARAAGAGEALNFLIYDIRPFLIEAAVLFLLMLFVSALIGDALIGSAVVFGAFVVMSFIHVTKMAARNEPFLPVDFTFILSFGDMSSMTKPMDNAKQIILIAVVLVVCVGASVLLRRFGVTQIGFRKLPRLRAAAGVISLALLLIISFSFVYPRDARAFEEKLMGVDFNDWDQSVNYKENGFIIGFLYNMAKVRMDEPSGYSGERIAAIVAKYERRAGAENAGRTDPSDSDMNIVYIMNES
ncbi:MAG: hypothetical protein LBC58_06665, partial [Clostridiales Family XIII bacterium]|nr:hypothetical protein [Clostridiales Family XIII bacterium]